MASQDNFNPRLLRLDEITILNAQIINKSDWTNLPKEQSKFSLSHKFEIATNIEGKGLRLIHTVNIEMINKEKPTDSVNTGTFDIGYYFTLDNYKDVFDKEPEIINDNISVGLINVSYSTSRGIIFTRCLGTVMKNLIMPILNPADIAQFEKEKITPLKKVSKRQKAKK